MLREPEDARGLQALPTSLYQGLWSPREFIATQGPLLQTVGDFWRLVWEQQSHTLVMLTNCMEFGRVRGTFLPGPGGLTPELRPVTPPGTLISVLP